MNPIQEKANALSMCAPLIYISVNLLNNFHPGVFLLFLGTAYHLPLSFLFHWKCATDPNFVPSTSEFRKLDQTYIHLATVLYVIAINPILDYVLLVLAYNAFAIGLCWRPTPYLVDKHWIFVYAALLAPLFPLYMFNTQYQNFVIGFFGLTLGGIPFTEPVNTDVFKGWGHALFHLLITLYAHALCSAVHASPLKWPFHV
jgi:hypothetical protein